MKKVWIVGMMMFLPLSLQAMEEDEKKDENLKPSFQLRSPSPKKSLARSPMTTNFNVYHLQAMDKSVEVIKVEPLHLPKQGPKISNRGGVPKNTSLLKEILKQEHLKKNILRMKEELKKFEKEEPLGASVVLEDRSVLGESIVRSSSPDFTIEKN